MDFRTALGNDAEGRITIRTASTGRRIRATGELTQPGTGADATGSTQPWLDAATLWEMYTAEPITDIVRDGRDYRITLGNVSCTVDAAALAEAMPTLAGGWGTLMCSLMVAEAAWDAGLPDVAMSGLLQAFRTGLTMDGSPEQAMLQIAPKLRLARIVEQYVGSLDGLIHDRARIAHFSPEALAGRTGNRLIQQMEGDPAKQRVLVATYRQTLDRSLDDAIQGIREARVSGAYAEAADLLQRFFKIGLDITGADEWHVRLSEIIADRKSHSD